MHEVNHCAMLFRDRTCASVAMASLFMSDGSTVLPAAQTLVKVKQHGGSRQALVGQRAQQPLAQVKARNAGNPSSGSGVSINLGTNSNKSNSLPSKGTLNFGCKSSYTVQKCDVCAKLTAKGISLPRALLPGQGS
ncbi:hypothetical protein AURDEDRAFT_172509 [Auricularia subglabra TFB-10046 SS5]|nr:hypothetical protein AURDEDRAFT_172509 [Auricularia subglabra TFB-10046 SS5]